MSSAQELVDAVTEGNLPPSVVAEADQIVARIRDCESTWSHNSQAAEDPFVSLAILTTNASGLTAEDKFLGNDVPSDRPKLIGANCGLTEPVDLADWLTWNLPPLSNRVCERCLLHVHGSHAAYLLVPAGTVVVALSVCGLCRDELNDKFEGIVWR